MAESVTLKQLLFGIEGELLQGSDQTPITGITCDSRQVKAGFLFVALEGFKQDGHRFAELAARQGAAALVVSRHLPHLPLPQFRAARPREALALITATFYGYPARRMALAAITGTNGKTTITYLLEHIWRQSGLAAGVIGTTGARWPGGTLALDHTTPEAPQLQQLLSEMLSVGVQACAMEVSSHALDLQRVRGTDFSLAVFTNLSRDHLDYHRDLESYARAKALLFEREMNESRAAEKFVVYNADDPWGEKITAGFRGERVGFSIDRTATVRPVEKPHITLDGLRCRVRMGEEQVEIRCPLIGRHNLMNVLAAAACAWKSGVRPETIARALTSFGQVPGRLERVDDGRGPMVLVDYAHTDDALRNVLSALRPMIKGRLVVVFGCGGDRDRGKRPLMGQVVSELADLALVTSDNPRSENPEAIIADIVPGLRRGKLAERSSADIERGGWTVISDRRQAIRKAVQLAGPGDVVLIAGKGHEDYQIIANQRLHFDDREEARMALALKYGENRP